MNYYIIRGRHRHAAAAMAGVSDLRCDVHMADGRVQLRVIPVEDLEPDPESQIDFTFNEKWARKMGATWDPELCGVLDVTPVNSGQDLSPERRNKLKIGKDRDRRNVKALETFLNEVGCGDPVACGIVEILDAHGYEVGKLKSGEPTNRIEAVKTLKNIYSRGPDHLAKVLVLNSLWNDEPKTNQTNWLGGLSVFVANGWAEDLSPAQYKSLKEAIPAKIVRRAEGMATQQIGRGRPGEQSELAPIIAGLLKKRARIRRKS